jgi:hypothetical protein
MFQLGTLYSRDEINAKLGGSKQKYLPHRSGHVVCGCFRRDLNPNAPDEVLPGNSDDIVHWAHVFSRQQQAVPIFIKRDISQWEYVGAWKVASTPIEDVGQIAVHSKRTGRADISMILRLERG